MSRINRKFFFDQVKLSLFDGKLSAPQVQGLTAVLDRWETDSAKDDDRWLAYMLGTAHHETGRTMQAVRETFASSDEKAAQILEKAFDAGKLTWVKTPYWRADADGKRWLGRGFVQLTHKANYEKIGKALKIDLVQDPTLAMSLPVAVAIMFAGMRNGLFTGKRLATYFSGTAEDWRNARRIINGVERADLVASYARTYYAAISYTTG